MTSGAPWSVKGIDPKAREVAKDMARRSGMTLGEWLNTVIMDGDEELGGYEPEPAPPEPPCLEGRFSRPLPPQQVQTEGGDRIAAALDRLSQRIESAEQRSSLAISGVDHSVQGVLARLAGLEQTQTAVVERVESVERDQTAVASRLDAALMSLRDDREADAARLKKIEEEGAGPRSVEALRSLEAAVGKVAAHLYEGEGRNKTVLNEIGREFDAVSRRLEQLESKPLVEPVLENLVQREVGALTRRMEALEDKPDVQAVVQEAVAREVDAVSRRLAALEDKPDPQPLMEAVVGRMMDRLEKAEGETAAALTSLRSSFADLDGRLQASDARAGDSAGLERLAADLTAQVQAVRAEMAEGLERVAAGRSDQVDAVVRDLAAHVEAAERRSAQAIEKMGHEVLRIADTLGRRMQSVEHRTADAVETVGGEVARIGGVLENRLKHSDQAHAEALERLGGEIARISERLAERIAGAERRSAQAFDDVGEQVARVTDKLNTRHEHVMADIAERIRQSEARTARFLEEAREKLDQRLTEAQSRLTDHVTPMQRSVADVQSRLEQMEATSSYMSPFGKTGAEPVRLESFADRGPAPMRARMEKPADAAPSPFDDDFMFDRPAPTPAAAAPVPAALPDEPASMDESVFEPAAVDESVFEPTPMELAPEPEPLAPLSTRDVLERARASVRTSAGPAADGRPAAAAAEPKSSSLFGSLKLPGLGKSQAKRGSTLRTALLASATAATLSVLMAGWIVFDQSGAVTAEREIEGDRSDRTLYGEDAVPAAPRQAASLTVEPTATAIVAPTAAADGAAAELYAEAVSDLQAGQTATGLAGVRKAASQGHAPAQLHLANLYSTGGSGLKADPAEARRWTERAAQAGDKRAMHNLGLMYFEGDGGDKNLTLAAQWFRRAADLGLTDSQYNLGLVHEKGFGVTQNPAEAYKWYLIAARGGDGEARKAAGRVQKTLSPEASTTAERSALAFRFAGAPGTTTTAAAASALSATVNPDVAAAQRALSQLGFYQGPTDGRSSPALRAALAAWQRTAGQEPDGVVDAQVVGALAAAT